jgi:hypothetical protein
MPRLTIELAPETERRLQERAQRQGQHAIDYARQLLEWDLQQPGPAWCGPLPTEPSPPAEDSDVESDDARTPAWRRFVKAGKRLPPEVLEELPRDGARNLDHYLYGAPRQKL